MSETENIVKTKESKKEIFQKKINNKIDEIVSSKFKTMDASNSNIDETNTSPDFKQQSIGDRLNLYENIEEFYIKPCELFAVRLDGSGFSKLLHNILTIHENPNKKRKVPYDKNIMRAMDMTMKDIVEKFNANTGYTHSDEITIIFSFKTTTELYNNYLDKLITKNDIIEHDYKGRLCKYISLMASYCSNKFTKHLSDLIDETTNIYNKKFIDKVKSGCIMFDARIIKFSEDKYYEIVNYQIWRSIHDCKRNIISDYALYYFGPKLIQDKNGSEKILMLEQLENIKFYDLPIFARHGRYCKRKKNQVTGKYEYILFELEISFCEEHFRMLLDKELKYDYPEIKDYDTYDFFIQK